ncbi:hypothetical protein ROD_10501 [Citrobacter rodentium ICC168]|uniref:Uncharacterized protein n=1 Tax=Citrobacter rodentium (strain ICC168) TaxID=637910 RepID=D2TT15_CITRI|nr:hypothetical protein ROD_10501 [Citrobacter rodentium ICC168]
MNKIPINLQVSPVLVKAYLPEFAATQVSFTRKVNELSVAGMDVLSSLCEYTERTQIHVKVRQSVRVRRKR